MPREAASPLHLQATAVTLMGEQRGQYGTPRRPGDVAASTGSQSASQERVRQRVRGTQMPPPRSGAAEARLWSHVSHDNALARLDGPHGAVYGAVSVSRGGAGAMGGRPPPSASSALSADNLRAHEANSPAHTASARSGSRRSRTASVASSGRSSQRSRSSRTSGSAASAPLRRVDWNQVVAEAEEVGPKLMRRAYSENYLTGRTQGADVVVGAIGDERRLRGAGHLAPEQAQDSLVSQDGPPEYRRHRGQGSSPPKHKMGDIFPDSVHDPPPALEPYRPMRASRNTTPARDGLTVPLGKQTPKSYERLYPVPQVLVLNNHAVANRTAQA